MMKGRVGVVLLLLLISISAACITPPSPLTANYYINTNFSFCQGTYDVGNFEYIINSSNIVVDCNGSTFTGTTSSFPGVYFRIDSKSNVEMKNCNFLGNAQRKNVHIQITRSAGVNIVNTSGNMSGGVVEHIRIENSSYVNINNTRITTAGSKEGITIKSLVAPGKSENINIYNTTIFNPSTFATGVSINLNNPSFAKNVKIEYLTERNTDRIIPIKIYSASTQQLQNITIKHVRANGVARGIDFQRGWIKDFTLYNITFKGCSGGGALVGIYTAPSNTILDGNLNFTKITVNGCQRGVSISRALTNISFTEGFLCYNSITDLEITTFPGLNRNNLYCDTSTPGGLCEFPCPRNVLVTSIRPSTPTPTDPIVCTAFVDSLSTLDVEFKFYVNGVYQPALDQIVSGCVPGNLCSSAPVGPFPAGTEIFCSARGVDPATGTSTSVFYSPVIIVRDLGGGAGGDAPDDVENVFSTLPLSVSQVCENDQAKFTIATIPGTRVNIYNDETGDLVDFVVAGADGLAYFYTNSTITYRFEGVKNYYYNEERVLKARDCLKACDSSADCSGEEVCSEGRCVALECGYCQVARYNTCINLECCKPSDCGAGYRCENNQCIALQCGEGEEVQGNQCVPKGKSLEERIREQLSGIDGDIGRLMVRMQGVEEEVKGLQGEMEELRSKVILKPLKLELPWWLILIVFLSLILSVAAFYKAYKKKK